jgi:hypothetical protein
LKLWRFWCGSPTPCRALRSCRPKAYTILQNCKSTAPTIVVTNEMHIREENLDNSQLKAFWQERCDMRGEANCLKVLLGGVGLHQVSLDPNMS